MLESKATVEDADAELSPIDAVVVVVVEAPLPWMLLLTRTFGL